MLKHAPWFFLTALACGRPAAPPQSSIQRSIERAADAENVPRPLLLALSYVESRWSMNPGHQSVDGAWGLFHLVDGPDAVEERSLLKAAHLTGLPAEQLRNEAFGNALGGAALLRAQADRVFPQYANLSEDRLGDWFEVVMLDSGLSDARLANSFAASVFRALRDGVTGTDGDGAAMHLDAQSFDLDGRAPWTSLEQDLSGEYCPGGHCVPFVAAANYTRGRSHAVDRVVIHDMEGYYEASIGFFTHPSTQASIHYDVRSSDGDITQQTHDGDTAWHAGDWTTNTRSVGIEHEGFAHDGAKWYTEAMYKSSAALTRWLCDHYNIPKDRSHIIGHYEVPNPNHAGWYGGVDAHHDPCDTWAGSPTWHNVTRCYWDWNHYLDLVKGGAPPPPKGTLSGFVGDACCGTGASKKAIADATVTLSGTSASTTTNSAGQYTFSLSPGDYTPRADAAHYQPGNHTSVGGTATVAVKSGQTTTASILLKPDAVAAPTVKITSPATGATVAVTPVTVSGTCGGAASVKLGSKTVSCSSGKFSGSVALAVGANTITASISNAGGSASSSVKVTYTPPATGIAGRITSGGAAVASAAVSLSNGASTTSSSTGSYSLKAPSGTYTLSVHATGYQAFSASVTIGSGIATRDVALTKVSTVGAPVVEISDPNDGDTLNESPVTVRGTVDDASVHTVSINGASAAVTDGAFEASIALQPGSNTITASASNAGGTGSASVHVTYEPIVTGLQGTVSDQDSGDPIAGATLTYGGASARSGSDGHYVLDAPSSEGDLVIAAAGYETQTLPVVVPDTGLGDMDVALVKSEVDTGGAPQVSIWSPSDGDTVDSASVAVSGSVDDPLVSSVTINGVPTAVTDGDFEGSAELQPGPNAIVVEAVNSHGTGRARIQVTYQPAQTGVQGTITSSGAPVPFALVVLQGGHGSAQTGDDGTYLIPAKAGSYTVAVSAGGYAPDTQDVDVTDGELAQADFDLTVSAASGAPEIIISEPIPGQVVTSSTVAVRGTVSDVNIATVLIGGNTFPAANGIFEGEAVLPGTGPQQIDVSATGAGGTGTASVTVNFQVSSSGLWGRVASAADGLSIMGAVLQLDVEHHAVTDFGGRYRLEAAPGSYTLKLSAAGYLAVERPVSVASGDLGTMDLLLVPVPPAGATGKVKITSPQSGDTVPKASVVIEGTATGVTAVTVNGVDTPLVSGAFKSTVQLSAGDNPIYARGTDADGHVFADAIYLTYSPPEGGVVAGAGCSSAGGGAAWLVACVGFLLAQRRRAGSASR